MFFVHEHLIEERGRFLRKKRFYNRPYAKKRRSQSKKYVRALFCFEISGISFISICISFGFNSFRLFISFSNIVSSFCFFFRAFTRWCKPVFGIFVHSKQHTKAPEYYKETNFAPNGNMANLHMVTMLTKPAVPMKAFKRIL